MKVNVKWLFLSIILGVIFYFSNVYAVDLKFEASLDKNREYYVFYTSVNASSHSYETFEKVMQDKGLNPIEARERYYITPKAIPGNDGEYVGSMSHYDVTGLLIHKLKYKQLGYSDWSYELQNHTIYSDSESFGFVIAYDNFSNKNGNKMNASTKKYLESNYLSTTKKYIKLDEKNQNINDYVIYGFNNESENIRGNRFYTEYTISKDGKKVIYRYSIERKKVIDKLIESKSVKNSEYVGDDKYVKYDPKDQFYKMKISMRLTTSFPNNAKKDLYTTSQFYNNMYGKTGGWSILSRGISWVDEQNKEIESVKGTSAANDMDNELCIPKNVDEAQISVYHVIHKQDGSEQMVGGNHILESGNAPSVEYNQGGANHYEYEYTSEFWGKDEKKLRDEKIKLNENSINSQGTTYYFKNVEISYINSDAYKNYEDTDWKSLKVANGGNIEVKYHYYPADSRDIYVGYFDSSGNRIEIGKNPKSNNGVSNALYNYNSNAEEKYQTSLQMTFTGEKTVSYNQKNYYLQEIKVHKLRNNEYSGDNKYSKLISYDKKLGVFKFNNFNETINSRNNYTVAADKQNYYVAFIYSEKPPVTYKVVVEHRTSAGKLIKTDVKDYSSVDNGTLESSKKGYIIYKLDGDSSKVSLKTTQFTINNFKYIFNNNSNIYYTSSYKPPNIYKGANSNAGTVEVNGYTDSKPIAVVTFYYKAYQKKNVYVERRKSDGSPFVSGTDIPAKDWREISSNFTVNTNVMQTKDDYHPYYSTYAFFDTNPNNDTGVENGIGYITSNEKDVYKYSGYSIKDNVKSYEYSNYKSGKSVASTAYKTGKLAGKKSSIVITFFYKKDEESKKAKFCPTLSLQAVLNEFKGNDGKSNGNYFKLNAECSDDKREATSECTANDLYELELPTGENALPLINNAPYYYVLNSSEYDNDGKRGGVWQSVEYVWSTSNKQYDAKGAIKDLPKGWEFSSWGNKKDAVYKFPTTRTIKKGKRTITQYRYNKYSVIGYKVLVLQEANVKNSDKNNLPGYISNGTTQNVYKNDSINNATFQNTTIAKKIKERYEGVVLATSDNKSKIYKYGDKINDINGYSDNLKIEQSISGVTANNSIESYNGTKAVYANIKYVTLNVGENKYAGYAEYASGSGENGLYNRVSPYLYSSEKNNVTTASYTKTDTDRYKSDTNEAYVNIVNPINLGFNVKGLENVDHTTSNKKNSIIIQNNAKINVVPTLSVPSIFQRLSISNNFDKIASYVKEYYFRFSFDVKYENKPYASNTWIKVNLNTNKEITPDKDKIYDNRGSIEVQISDARYDENGGYNTSVISDLSQNKIEVIAVSNNIPTDYNINDLYENQKTKITNKTSMPESCSSKEDINWSNTLKNSSKLIKNYANYIVAASKTYRSVGRVYDFKITDCTDVDFKSVFRKSDTNNNKVNAITGTVYFSGIKKLEIYGTSTANNFTNIRFEGNNKYSGTLPLGPYKQKQSNYIDAPKMGYRISFDLKTTGYYTPNNTVKNKINKKEIKITPSYYYIAKNGDSRSIIYERDLDLFYKSGENKYVSLKNSNFSISYKPNDGYRNIYDEGITSNSSMLTDKYVSLNMSKGFTLDDSTVCTNDNGYIQTWYGEFKLPNTTIAVKKVNGKTGDVNNPLTDGYLGVKFNIECVYYNDSGKEIERVSYNTPNKNASGTNTTQWDYEGYLGFKNAGKDVTGNDGLYLQFPKGKLMISSQTDYEQIRGTVVFFDLDNRASNDFE